MKPTIENHGEVWLYRSKAFGLVSAARLQAVDHRLFCWIIGDEEPHKAFEGDFEWLGPAMAFMETEEKEIFNGD